MIGTFIQEILKGLFVGVCVSAPVGPLGVLTIQRTISKGKWHGVVTGLGATTSDIIYAILVGLGMNFIINFIDAHQYIIQIIGSIVIAIFGIIIFRSKSKPKAEESFNRRRADIEQSPALKNVKKDSYRRDYLTAFGLCFSNPLIIFLFIGLFAQFHLFAIDNVIVDIATVISIIIGAFLWWMTLTWIVGTFAKSFNEKGLKKVNHITGAILVIAACVAIAQAIMHL